MNKINEIFDLTNADSILLRTDGDRIDSNFYYFSELSKKSELSSFMVLKKGKKPLIITNILEYEGLRKNKQLDVICYHNLKDFSIVLKKHLSGRIGVNYYNYSIGSFRNLKKIIKHKKFIDVSENLAKIREVKTSEEIKKISDACCITEELLKDLPNMIKIGITEKTIANELEHKAKKNGAEGLSYPPIVAVGSNASVPHHITGKTKISKGKILLIDFGIVYNGYCSDLTRTFFVGKSSEKARHVYSVVYRSQREAISKLKEGSKASDIFAAANSIIENTLKQKMIHGLGHGLGIDVHDFPSGIGEKSKFVLKENMCITVEPGYYKGEIGVRIEDDVIVKKNGCKLLSNAPKELIEI